jgi:hypothetical protein
MSSPQAPTMLRHAAAAAVLIGAATMGAANPQMPPAADILQHSIDYHDPQGLWSWNAFRIQLAGTRPIAGPTLTEIVIDNVAGRFTMQRDRYGQLTETAVTGEDCWTRLDGSSELTPEQVERYRLSCEQMRGERDYHTFLYGLPMKLRDPGTLLHPEAIRTEFQGEDVWQVRITYDPDVGTDTWYFYIHPRSFALVGYRFYHDEAANDGEYIVLDRITEGGGMRLSKVRSWYSNSDDRLMGTDTVRSIERLSRNQ